MNTISEITPAKETWKLHVRVERLWTTYSPYNPTEKRSMKLILLDAKLNTYTNYLSMDQNCSNQSDFSTGTPMQKQSYTSSNGKFFVTSLSDHHTSVFSDNFLATQARKVRKILMTDRQQIHTDPLLNKQTHLPLPDLTNVYQYSSIIKQKASTHARQVRKSIMQNKRKENVSSLTHQTQTRLSPLTSGMKSSLTHQTQTPLSPLTNVESGTVETIDVISEAVSSSNIPRTSIICTENGMKSPLSQQIQSQISSLVNAPISIEARKMRKSTLQQQRYKFIRQEKSILAAASQQFYEDIVDHISAEQSINTNIINNTGNNLKGTNYHRIGSLLPTSGNSPKFSQLYIYDTEHEVENRINVMRIQERKHEAKTLLFSRRLFQQILVDGYTMVESERISYIKNNQIFMPTSFTGGARFLDSRGLNPEDRPDIVCRLFKIKLDQIIKDMTENRIFGSTRAVIYTVEFQKRGLPHAHILLFLKRDRKTPIADDVDQIISAEIPDQVAHPRLYELVSTHMMHGLCSSSGNEKACMKKGKYQENNGTVGEQHVDETQNYYNCRYVSPCEAVWRIFAFDIHYRDPAVQRLSFHLPDEQSVVFNDGDTIDYVVENQGTKQSMFLGWMECNRHYPEARSLMYLEFPTKFVWKRDERVWKMRKKVFAIGRLDYVPPGIGELYYLSLMLHRTPGAISYEHIRTVNNVIYPSFKDACYTVGLLDDDKEYIDGIIEASFWGSPHFLRKLFASLLLSESVSRLEHVWENTWKVLADDILPRQRSLLGIDDLHLSDVQLKNYTLTEIDNMLEKNGRSLRDCKGMPLPDDDMVREGNNRLIQQELNYDRSQLEMEHRQLCSSLTDEQKAIYEEIINATSNDKGGIFFVYGYGGTGKTFIWRTLFAALRCKGEIVLNVASSGVAALLLPLGRTAHSRFGIPINVSDKSMCTITPGTELAALINKTRLIIWDEAPMMNRYCFEALDRSLKHIATDGRNVLPFGGKVIVLGGDFRQILPVVTKGSREDIVYSSISSSPLWHYCKVLRLTKNMRLTVGQTMSSSRVQEIKDF
ncbi:hypothetical protein OROMI_005740 [Orobanche minor]